MREIKGRKSRWRLYNHVIIYKILFPKKLQDFSIMY